MTGVDGERGSKEARMDAEHIFRVGEHGIHLLFDATMIGAAFEEDPARLHAWVATNRASLEMALAEILAVDRAEQARAFIAELPRELRHVLVLLYFEILDRRMQRRPHLLH